MADVFISYKSERRAAAEHLAEILADYGYSVWWDYGLVSGRDFGAQIEKELRAAKAVIVLWCSLSRESEWVLDEATLAKRLDTVIPTMIERIDLPLGFGRTQTLDLVDWDGAPQSHKLDRLLRDVAAKVGRAPVPNLEGLERSERAWRRFGAPSLAHFALITPLERKEPPRTLPSAIAPASDVMSSPAPSPSPAQPPKLASGKEELSRGDLLTIISGSLIVFVALTALITSSMSNSTRPPPSEGAAFSEQVENIAPEAPTDPAESATAIAVEPPTIGLPAYRAPDHFSNMAGAWRKSAGSCSDSAPNFLRFSVQGDGDRSEVRVDRANELGAWEIGRYSVVDWFTDGSFQPLDATYAVPYMVVGDVLEQIDQRHELVVCRYQRVR